MIRHTHTHTYNTSSSDFDKDKYDMKFDNIHQSNGRDGEMYSNNFKRYVAAAC